MIATPSTQPVPEALPASVSQRLKQWVKPADKILTLKISPVISLPDCKRLTPNRCPVRQLTPRIRCFRLSFSEAVTQPAVTTLPLKYPVQTGQECLTLNAVVKQRPIQLSATVPCFQQTTLMAQLPLRWGLIPMDKLDVDVSQYIGKHIRQQLSHDPMANYWKAQGVFTPVYPNKVFKVLRHPSGYLIGLPGQPAESQDSRPAKAHYVVWLSTGKTKSQLLWVPVPGAIAC